MKFNWVSRTDNFTDTLLVNFSQYFCKQLHTNALQIGSYPYFCLLTINPKAIIALTKRL